MKIEFTLKSSPFDWNDNFSEVAIEDFNGIRDKLSYGTCQSIGMALAKLEILEKQGCKVEESDSKDAEDAVCYGCRGYGDDYYIDEHGDLVCYCPECPFNPFNEEDAE